MAIPTKSDLKAVLLEVDGDVSAVAERFACSTDTVQRWIKAKNLSAEQMRLAQIADDKRRESFTRVLQGTGGNITKAADVAKVSRQTVYTWIEKWQLHDVMDDARDTIFEMAETNIFTAVKAGDLDQSRFVLTNMPPGKNRQRWSAKTEISATVVGIPLSEETLQKLAVMGYTPDMVAAELENLLTAALEAESSDVGD